MIAAMLLTATSAYGYREAWTGWFRTGTLTYGGNAYVNANTSTHGTASDSTYSVTRDTFYQLIWTTNKAFVYSAGDDTIYLSVTAFTGGKETNQSGTKDGNGIWYGTTVCTIDNQTYSVSGTWDTNGDLYYFDYTDYPPDADYTARWDITGGDMGHPTGWGTSYGDLQ